VGLHRVDVLGEHRLGDLGDQALVGDVDALDLDLRGVLVQEVVELALREVADRGVGVEEPAASEDPAVPPVHRVAGDRERTLVQGLGVVVQGGEVEVLDGAAALAAGTHAADDVELTPLLGGGRPTFDRDRAGAARGRDVERERLRRSEVRPAEAAEQDPQHRVRVRHRPYRRARVRAQALLVDDDRRREAVEDVDVGPGEGRHEPLHERAVRLVDEALRLGGDGAEHERALP
jgi:hypothetical protein